MKQYMIHRFFSVIVLSFLVCIVHAQTVSFNVDYDKFLSNHDMLWDEIPNRWELAPYSGNGNVGFLFYRTESEGKNIMSIYAGRHDYYDHREAPKENQMLWIYRSRLPLGHFNLESKGEIIGVDLRLSLWDAELTGVIKTSEGSYQIHGFTHSEKDVIYFETSAQEGECIKITWHPEEPIPPVYASIKGGSGPKGGNWDKMRNAPMPMPPAPIIKNEKGVNYCTQMLYDNRGETTTAWIIDGKSNGKQTMLTSIHHSFPEHNSKKMVQSNLTAAQKMIKKDSFFKTHKDWWHQYYPQSFITFNDAEKEAFYWIQMYKFASATRGNGPIMDLMGPWYHKTFWPMVWGDLNVQLQYWTHLAANRLSVGESLVNNVDKYAENLASNVPDHWDDCAALAALFPQDMKAYDSGKVPDMLAWVLHDYWMHCEYAGDRDRMRDGLFPILRKTVNSYFKYLEENPVKTSDGKIHIKNSWSPEYPGGHGKDINFTIALMRWSCQTLLDINDEFELNDPLKKEWQNIIDNLVNFQIDKNGLRIGKEIPFDKPHRHYSHLLGFYPLAVITPDNEQDKEMLRKTVDHWLQVSIYGKQTVDKAMPVTGYTATGAASMYAWLGDPEKAYYYLDFLIKHKNVSSTTMYAEGNPVIESPLSFATCIHDMLLQSWGGKIRVFAGTPERWGDAAFHDLRTQGAFLVSAKRKEGNTQFVSVKSTTGNQCVISPDIDSPHIYIGGEEVTSSSLVQKSEDGFFTVDLKSGESVVFMANNLAKSKTTIEAILLEEKDCNLFGYSKKTEKLPGHNFYKNKKR